MIVYLVKRGNSYWSTNLQRWTTDFEKARCFTKKRDAESYAKEQRYHKGLPIQVIAYKLEQLMFVEQQVDA